MLISIDIGHSYVKCMVYDPCRRPQHQIYSIEAMGDEVNVNYIRNVFSVQFENDKMKVMRVGSVDLFDDGTIAVDKLKSYMNRQDMRVPVDESSLFIDSEKLLCFLFNHIRKKVIGLSPDDTIRAVITIPVSYSEVQKKRLRNAAERVGMEVYMILTEPFAGLFSRWEWLTSNDKPLRKALIFDIGAGTIDASCVKIRRSGSSFNVSTLMSTNLAVGGNDISEMLYNDIFGSKDYQDIIDNVARELITSPASPEGSKAYMYNLAAKRQKIIADLKNCVNKMKESICSNYDRDKRNYFPIEKVSTNLMVTKLADYFDTINSGNITRSYSDIDRLIRESDYDIGGMINRMIAGFETRCMINDVDSVIFLGGSARVHYFCEVILKELSAFVDNVDVCMEDINNCDNLNDIARGALEFARQLEKKTISSFTDQVSLDTFEYGTINAKGVYVPLAPNIRNSGEIHVSAPETMMTMPDGSKKKCVSVYRQSLRRSCGKQSETAVYIGSVEVPESHKSSGVKIGLGYDPGKGISAALYHHRDNTRLTDDVYLK